jgi:hypothetical protein
MTNTHSHSCRVTSRDRLSQHAVTPLQATMQSGNNIIQVVSQLCSAQTSVAMTGSLKNNCVRTTHHGYIDQGTAAEGRISSFSAQQCSQSSPRFVPCIDPSCPAAHHVQRPIMFQLKDRTFRPVRIAHSFHRRFQDLASPSPISPITNEVQKQPKKKKKKKNHTPGSPILIYTVSSAQHPDITPSEPMKYTPSKPRKEQQKKIININPPHF